MTKATSGGDSPRTGGARKVIATKRRGYALRESRMFYLFVSPWLIGFVLLGAGPILASAYFSFTRYEIVGTPVWVGLRNYSVLFFSDPLFWQSLKVTGVYTVASVPINITFSVILALLMNVNVRGIAWIRTAYYTPMVVSGVAVALLWQYILNPTFGILNHLLWTLFRIEGPAWTFSETWVIPSFVMMSLWRIGGSVIVYLAGLQGVPTELYEAASIDGAGRWHSFWKITLPLITPVILYNLVIGIINSFQVFTEAFVMTQGGPNNASLFYNLYLYDNAFRWFKMGYASALAWILFVITLLFTLLAFRTSRRWVTYDR